MNFEESELLLNEVNKIYNKIPIKEKTFMEISGYPYYENVCSNILAFYLNPKEEHKLGSVLINSLIKVVKNKGQKIYKDIDLSHLNIYREYTTLKGNRIDIVIQNEEIVIGIENKIYASVYNDLEDYAKTLNKLNNNSIKLLLSVHQELRNTTHNDFINITYSEFFKQLKQDLKSYKQIENKWYIYLIDFINNIEGFEVEKGMELEITNWIIQHTLFKEPFKKINSDRKIIKKLPNYLSLDEAKKMINVYANSKYDLDIRDNAVIHLFLNSGLRLSELKNVSIDDLKLDNGTFSIIGKGNKERTGYINEITKKALEEYLRIRNNFSPKGKTLFVSRYGTKMSSTAIEKIIKKAYKKAEINDEDYCVHTLRHTCATLLYRKGINIRTIQELLGHVQIDTTEIYTHLHDQEVMDAMLDHPLSQFKILCIANII